MFHDVAAVQIISCRHPDQDIEGLCTIQSISSLHSCCPSVNSTDLNATVHLLSVGLLWLDQAMPAAAGPRVTAAIVAPPEALDPC